MWTIINLNNFHFSFQLDKILSDDPETKLIVYFFNIIVQVIID